MIWDRDAKQELPTEKEAITSWFGKKIGLLITKIVEDKYNEEHKSRDVYDVQHILDYETGQTRNEKTSGKTGFKDKWLEANPIDKVIDKRDKSKDYVEPSKDGGVDINDDEIPF